MNKKKTEKGKKKREKKNLLTNRENSTKEREMERNSLKMPTHILRKIYVLKQFSRFKALMLVLLSPTVIRDAVSARAAFLDLLKVREKSIRNKSTGNKMQKENA